ncbi:MAG: two-component regulator propeller domain-containing protein [Bacteroidota bacterium]
MYKKRSTCWRENKLAVSILLLLLVSIFSCTGSQDQNPREASLSATEVALRDTITPPADPFFYIEGQLCQHARTIYQDRNDNLWIGTNVYGLMWYDGDTLRYLDEKDGIGGGRITAILEDEAGNVWFGSYRGLTKYDGTAFTHYKADNEAISNSIWSIHLDQNGEFWLGTDEGVVRFDGEQFTAFPIPQIAVEDTNTILSYRRVTSVIEDGNGSLWFGTDGFGVCTYDGDSFGRFTTKNGLPDNNVGDLMKDRQGNIWIGTMFGGISRYSDGEFVNLTQEGVVDGIEAGQFYEGPDGNIWLAAEHVGVYRYDGTTFTKFDQEDGLNSSGILSFYKDREDRFWLGGWGGLFRMLSNSTFVSVTKEGPWE